MKPLVIFFLILTSNLKLVSPSEETNEHDDDDEDANLEEDIETTTEQLDYVEQEESNTPENTNYGHTDIIFVKKEPVPQEIDIPPLIVWRSYSTT